MLLCFFISYSMSRFYIIFLLFVLAKKQTLLFVPKKCTIKHIFCSLTSHIFSNFSLLLQSNIMDQKFSLITDISPGQRNWTSKVVVAEKTPPKLSQNGQTRYQHMILMDEKVSFCAHCHLVINLLFFMVATSLCIHS